ncbi:decapping nuclease DXO homolog [Drosophila innubila]|uniref:decapping nuclease DXO homolog n=1 Tax=Drosophila innubila TaxID=198719 RepID=UPI00148CF75F|nr:decapping nuclease DXO homolog [Drosophila innubila]
MSGATKCDGALHLNVRLHKLAAQFAGAFPNLSRPQPIGFYSINEAREFQDDASNATYLFLPPRNTLPLNLNAGIENVQRKVAQHEYHDIYQFCQYIYNHQELLVKSSNGQLRLDNDFVTFRGILRLIMCTPYEKQKDYKLMATRLNDTIYIAKVETEADRIDREQMTQRQLDMCSWGFKFEQYCTTDTPNIPPKTNVPVIEAKEFACVYRCKLNGMNLLYGAEMDGMKSDVIVDLDKPEQLRSVEFVELKTTAHQLNRNQQRSFDNYKSLNWWCQSYLVGIRTILAGLRDNQGLLHDIKEYNVTEMHRQKPWSPAAVVTFLSNFLHELKSLIEHIDDPNDPPVVMLDYIANEGQVLYTVLQGTHRPPMLPNWYRQLFRGET